jgi:2-(1,2-epoxy-1,2-dihydrophenyl)acetyl-CoA isomerase
MKLEWLVFESEQEIAVLTLKRPEVLNALSIPLARELEALVGRLVTDSTLRGLVITGAGRAFCAGGDLASFRQPREEMRDHSLTITHHLHAVIEQLARMPVPVVAAVNGVAAGAGFSLACACDLIVASRSASFIAAYTLAGLSPDLGLTYTLPRLVGLAKARSLILTNTRLSAEDAERMGIVTQLVPDGEVLSAARTLCAKVLEGSGPAIAASKRLLENSSAATLAQQLQAERQSLAELSAGEEAYERCRRFVK